MTSWTVSHGSVPTSLRPAQRIWRKGSALLAALACIMLLAAPLTAGVRTTRTGSGLRITHLVEGTGSTPKPTSHVKVEYHGTLVNGDVFDSTEGRGPAAFSVSGVIPCWTEALQLMKVGGTAKIVCPAKIAYGLAGSPPDIPPNATLHFEVQLLVVY